MRYRDLINEDMNPQVEIEIPDFASIWKNIAMGQRDDREASYDIRGGALYRKKVTVLGGGQYQVDLEFKVSYRRLGQEQAIARVACVLARGAVSVTGLTISFDDGNPEPLSIKPRFATFQQAIEAVAQSMKAAVVSRSTAYWQSAKSQQKTRA